MKDTPIIINNFNRLTATRNMRDFLIGRGFTNVVILDNNSTYPPLLEWYETLGANEVVRFNENFGAECLFESGYINNVKSEYLVYTDPDLELNPLMPDDFLEVMKALMLKYNENKIGLALRIDDVPADCHKNCFTGSINWERQFWANELEKDVYKGMVNTTFCLLNKPVQHDLNALRIAGNFTARHLPWYLRYNGLDEEELFYVTHAGAQSSFRNGYFKWQDQLAKSACFGQEKMEDKYFIAVYTNVVKDYCDDAFFSNLFEVSQGQPVFVVDNTIGDVYFNRLQNSFQQNGYHNFKVFHVDVPGHPKHDQFHRNIRDSVNFLRDIYLNHTTLPYFLIIESDVVSPADLLCKFENGIARLNVQNPDWGIVGGLYYDGFHNYNYDTAVDTLERTVHVLSGCSVYRRDLIEKFPFRHNPEDLGPFPDAFMSYDAGSEFSLWNEHEIKCDHLHNPVTGMRMS